MTVQMRYTYRINVARGWDDARVEEGGEELDDRVEVEECYNLFSTCFIAADGGNKFRSWQPDQRKAEGYAPTAVYLLLICRIIIAVMMMATMCTKLVAVGAPL